MVADGIRETLLLREVIRKERRLQLIKERGSAGRVLEDLLSSPHLFPEEGGKGRVESILSDRTVLSRVERGLEEARKMGMELIPFDDERYPALLKTISYPPDLLYLMGNPLVFDSSPCLGVVGARRSTFYTRKVMKALIPPLVRAGVKIASGFAQGVDTEAHRETLNSGGMTIAVMGTSLDNLYPASNRRLAREIMESGGALLSEFPPGTPSFPSNFPRRNRIVSGLSFGVLVVEAGGKSGALITARHALEQGREVFSVPGSIFSRVSEGCHKLIKEGAKTVTSASDILEEIIPFAIEEGRKGESLRQEIRLGGKEKRVFEQMCHEPMGIDEISLSTGIPAKEVSPILTSLEIMGLVERVEGKGFVRR